MKNSFNLLKAKLTGFKITRKKLLLLIPLILILGWLLWPKPKPEPVQLAQTKYDDVKVTVSASGILNGNDTANLRFKGSGRLSFINVKEGDQISKGQLVAGLDTQDLDITLQQAENNYRSAQSVVDKVLDDIHSFQYGNGGTGNVATANETETQRQLRTQAEVTRDNALDSVKAAQRAYQDAVLISPIDGIVTQTTALAGQTVGSADLIAQIVDWTKVYFDMDVDEADLAQVSQNQTADITLNSYPNQTFKGSVDQIIPQTKTTSSGATVVTVRIDLHNPAVRLVSGLNGQADIIVTQAKHVLAIPIEALKEDNTVLVQKGKEIKAVSVKVGLKSDTEVEIKDGLKDGDQVVTNPSNVKVTSGSQRPLSFLRIFRGRG